MSKTKPVTAGCEEGGRGQESMNVTQRPLLAGKSKKRNCPLGSSRKDTLILAQ